MIFTRFRLCNQKRLAVAICFLVFQEIGREFQGIGSYAFYSGVLNWPIKVYSQRQGISYRALLWVSFLGQNIYVMG